ncbi:hypothetical protein Tco_1084145 [Tanacetum coccineum]
MNQEVRHLKVPSDACNAYNVSTSFGESILGLVMNPSRDDDNGSLELQENANSSRVCSSERRLLTEEEDVFAYDSYYVNAAKGLVYTARSYEVSTAMIRYQTKGSFGSRIEQDASFKRKLTD